MEVIEIDAKFGYVQCTLYTFQHQQIWIKKTVD